MSTVTVRAGTGGWAWDSQMTVGTMKTQLTNTDGFSKSFEVLTENGDKIFIGVCGSYRMVNVLYPIVYPAFDADSESPAQYVLNKLVPLLSDKLEVTSGVSIEATEFDLLVEVAGQMFALNGDLSVMPITEFWALGSGSEFALGSMEFGASAREALLVASKWDTYTGGYVNER